jgi:hypothetical protein
MKQKREKKKAARFREDMRKIVFRFEQGTNDRYPPMPLRRMDILHMQTAYLRAYVYGTNNG